MAGQRAELQPSITHTGIAPTIPDVSLVSRGTFLKAMVLVALGTGSLNQKAEAAVSSIITNPDLGELPATPVQVDVFDSEQIPQASQEASAEIAAAFGPRIGRSVPVPDSYPSIRVKALTGGVVLDGHGVPRYKQGEWFHPVYDVTTADKAHDYRGIGPHYPVAFRNLDRRAAVITTHGNPGELIVSGRRGGRVEVAFMQLDKFQDDGAWSNGEWNPDWEMQYTFHGLRPHQRITPVNIDNGRQLVWDDGSLVDYKANGLGTASFEIPETHRHDVRVGFVFDMSAQRQGVQPPEIKIERGPNDKPWLRGENPLPKRGIIKPMLSGQHR